MKLCCSDPCPYIFANTWCFRQDGSCCIESFWFENIHVVKEQAEPDGTFPTVIYPNPEEAEALTMAIELGKNRAELVLARPGW